MAKRQKPQEQTSGESTAENRQSDAQVPSGNESQIATSPDLGADAVTEEAPSMEESMANAAIPAGGVPDLSAPTPPIPQAVTEPDMQKILTRREFLTSRAKELREVRDKASSELKQITDELATTAHLIERGRDLKANQRGIISYIQSQTALRLSRVTRRNEILKGLKLEDIGPGKSQLDLAMARKTGRGTQRPMRPAMRQGS